MVLKNMKVFIILLCASVYHSAVLIAPYRNSDEYGASVQYKNQDVVGNYNFGYNEGHLSGGSFRRESGDAYGNKVGSYGLRDADGRLRIVNYIADSNGFRVKVDTNEPGVEPQDPASASINKPSLVPAPVRVPVPVPVAPYKYPISPYKFPVSPYKVPISPYKVPVSPYKVPIAPLVRAPVIPSAPIVVPSQVVPTAPIVSAPVIQPTPLLPLPLPGYPFLPPPPVVERFVGVPPYANNILPYKGYPSQYFSNYYGSPSVVGKLQPQPGPVIEQIDIDPPRYFSQPYNFFNGKSLPTIQPLGYS